MGRAGSGRSSGGMHHSSGGHSISRSSGGHSIGSSRATRSSFSSSRPTSRSMPSMSSSRPMSNVSSSRPKSRSTTPAHKNTSRPTRVVVNNYNYSGDRGGYMGSRVTYTAHPRSVNSDIGRPVTTSSGTYSDYVDETVKSTFDMPSIIIGVVAVYVLLIFFTALSICLWSGFKDPSSTIVRENLSGIAFQNDCIVDELGWFDNERAAESDLQYFYKETGVQPYVVLRDYDPTLTSEEDKELWARNYYEQNIDNEGTFLYVYFAEENVDEDVGYMCYVNGTSVSSIMDSEAIGIFWNYIDRYWYSDMSTDELFATVYTKTADTIMHVSTTTADVVRTVCIIYGLLIALTIFVLWWLAKINRDKEKAAETERILSTPMDELVKDKADELTSKYD